MHTVSSLKGTGIPALLDDLRQLVGEHGDVWVVGAQNSGATLPEHCHDAAKALSAPFGRCAVLCESYRRGSGCEGKLISFTASHGSEGS